MQKQKQVSKIILFIRITILIFIMNNQSIRSEKESGLDVVSCTCYVSGCENKATNQHIRGDYVVFICEDHNPSFK